MPPPTNIVCAAVIRRGRSTVPHAFHATASSCCHSSTLPRAAPRQFISIHPASSALASLYTIGRTSPADCPLIQATRQFSTAVAAEHSPEDEMYENACAREEVGKYIKNERDMPRLQALRERLLVERHQGGGISSMRKANIRPSSLHPSQDASRVMEVPLIDQPDPFDIADENILTDSHGRHHNYLRISLSERCNLRCQYCMPPEGVPLSPTPDLLTDEEILRLVGLFVKNGVDKVRLTGGEPLLRPNLSSLVRSISETLTSANGADSGNVDAAKEGGLVGITTNGISLSRQIDELVDAGLTGVNISLDTLCADRFMEITRRNGLDKVLRAVRDCVRAFRDKYGSARTGPDGRGGSRVKINCVVMKGFNDDELSDFVRMAEERFDGDVDVRFIEWMPFNDNGWNADRFVSYQDMMDKIDIGGTPIERIDDGPNDTTKWWRAQNRGVWGDGRRGDGGRARVGFITSMSEHFCSSCNRLRITADGKIKVCLFGSNEREVSLRDIMRNHQHENNKMKDNELSRAIFAAVQKKTLALGGHGNAENIAKAADNRPMTLIGG
mmetsp:Transcript_37667/g.80439  ORF Transcript_37667/g.80439 Transcript_37667/m.80439 type:complete len:556 (+) Transcript_37667:172-1839(+)|eukprot:CAMPEP_0172556760 /NCGR_PEP_ID=MMETSP1067-20121228/68696_1 /TAXON_ID=265564 ORGANISM="Thalassiosira punctigera, Strain Tpunct2005C2" /NCGR_SAMPLE_ID=MMETSP1067 /ASSEMBLY_ACC=CAM_ASM_000444 /LENGTH=555 /DNA_ID=CAMNT_0013345649 /DNA_START=107 /DNA_END=1774 /DNA_ORIENTATION=+